MAKPSAIEISRDIEREIASGTREPGERLAAVRDLAGELGVSPTTVSAAYRRLRERGLVVGRGRQGTRVAPQMMRASSPSPTASAGLIDAANGSPNPTLLPDLGPALAAASAQPQSTYGQTMLDADLAVAARRDFSADGVDAANIVVTNGAMDAIERVVAAVDLRPGDRIGVEDPGHIPVHQLARSAGLELVPLPIDEEGLTVAGLAVALRRGLAALVVTPRVHNPTGAAMSASRAVAIDAALAEHPDLVVIQDDHAGAISGVPWVGLSPPGERWATIRSLGKSLGPDLRIALVATDARTADRMAIAMSNGPGWVSHLLQRTAAHLLNDPSTAETVHEAATVYADRRNRLIARLAANGVPATGRSGLNVWIPTADEQGLVEAARHAGYAIRAADPWRIVSPSAVRVSIASLEEPDIDVLADALARPFGGEVRAPSI